MDNKDKMAFPFYEPGSGFGSVSEGLSKREWIAASLDVSSDMETYTVKLFEVIMGRKAPDEPIEKFKYWAEAEAKIRVIKADALLTELEKS